MTRIDKVWQGLMFASLMIVLDYLFPVIEGHIIKNLFRLVADTLVVSLFIGLTLLKYFKEDKF